MEGHHLVLGELIDRLTGEILPDTHDERYRQKIARFLVEDRGFSPEAIRPRRMLEVRAGTRGGRVPVDFVVEAAGRAAMMVKYGPGSLVTRHRSALAMGRLVADRPVPVVVVTNGEDADVLDGLAGKMRGSGWAAVPGRDALAEIAESADATPLSPERAEMEARIVYAYEIDGACPCDDTVCRIDAT
jgi:hypothetical protein